MAIDIEKCELEGPISETPIFEINGSYAGEEFSCKLELRFDSEEIDLDQVDYEYLDGADLGPEGLDVLEELINELTETDEYQEALENFKEIQGDLESLFE
jgi:hypothetical protein